MNKTNNSSSSGMLALLLVIISVLLTWLWIIPQYKENQADLAQVRKEVDAANAKLNSLKAAKTTLTSLGETVDKVLVAVPEDTDAGNIITTLEEIAAKNTIYIPSFQIGDNASSSTSSTGTVDVTFSISGKFADLNNFVKALETNLKFFNVKSVTIADGEGDIMSMTLQVEAYIQNNTSSLSL